MQNRTLHNDNNVLNLNFIYRLIAWMNFHFSRYSLNCNRFSINRPIFNYQLFGWKHENSPKKISNADEHFSMLCSLVQGHFINFYAYLFYKSYYVYFLQTLT
jgi:hypothetical protein